MRVLILGATGLAGQAFIRECSSRGLTPITLARKDADINLDVSNIYCLRNVLEDTSPDFVINLAALVNLRQCEDFPKLAWSVNTLPLTVLSDWSTPDTPV